MSTKEPQYNFLFDLAEKEGLAQFGVMANESWNNDPKRTLFTLARYKFVAKMFSGLNSVLEVGCADAFGTRIVQQEVPNVTAIDFDPLFIEDAKSRLSKRWKLELKVHDITSSPINDNFDAAFSLDVFEHIHPDNEEKFISNILKSIKPCAPVIIGIPSLESQLYASPQSKEGHINCKSGDAFRNDLKKYFKNVFLFSMNDEVVHTGYNKMAHYLIALCIGK